jgi:TolA-binding protein
VSGRRALAALSLAAAAVGVSGQRARAAGTRASASPGTSGRRAVAALALAAAVLVGGARPAQPAPAPPALPEPDLPFAPAPLPLALRRAVLEPPPPLPPLRAMPVDPGPPPVPPFDSAYWKGFPAVPEPGGFPCGLASVFGRAAALVRCGVLRIQEGELDRARQALEESLAAEPASADRTLASFWLAELDFHDARHDRAAARYQAALRAGLEPDLAAHAAVALGLIALRQGDLAGARAALAGLPREVGPPLATLGGFLDGLAQLLGGDPGAALARWDQAPLGLPPGIRAEAAFWRGVAFVQRWEPEPALAALGEARLDPRHPLHVDLLGQRGWAQLMRGMPQPALAELTAAGGPGRAPARDLRRYAAALVRAAVATDRYAEAHAAVRRLAADRRDDPLPATLLRYVAEEARRRQRVEAAIEAYWQLRTRVTDPADRAYLTYRIAEGFAQLGQAGDRARHQRAAQEYQRLRDEGGDEGLAQRAAYWLALTALHDGRAVAALNEAEALLRAGPVPDLRQRTLVLTAEAALRAHAPNRAARLFRDALAAEPESPAVPELRLALGWALLEDGDAGIALQEWQEAARTGAPAVAVAALAATAAAALDRGYDAEALRALGELERLAPDHPDGALLAANRGIVLVRMGDHAAAIAQLHPLLGRSTVPEREGAIRRALGTALYRTARYAEAQDMFLEAAQYEPGEGASWLGAGLAAYRQRRQAEAERALERARLSPAPEVAATAAYALVLLRAGNAEELRRHTGGFVAAFPAHPLSAALVGRLVADALAEGHARYALEWSRWLAKAQPASPAGAEILDRLADAEYPDFALAREAYEEVLGRAATPELTLRARLGLARAATAAGRGREAREAFERFIAEAPAADPRLPWAYGELVQVAEANGERDRALAAIEAFLARFPADASAPAMELRRGEILMAQRRWDLATRALQAARNGEDAGAAAQAHVSLGELFRARGEHDAAVLEYLGAMYLYPGTRAAALGMRGAAQSYAALQRQGDARIVLEKLAAQPDAALARWARQELARLPRPEPAPAADDGPRPGGRKR